MRCWGTTRSVVLAILVTSPLTVNAADNKQRDPSMNMIKITIDPYVPCLCLLPFSHVGYMRITVAMRLSVCWALGTHTCQHTWSLTSHTDLVLGPFNSLNCGVAYEWCTVACKPLNPDLGVGALMRVPKTCKSSHTL